MNLHVSFQPCNDSTCPAFFACIMLNNWLSVSDIVMATAKYFDDDWRFYNNVYQLVMTGITAVIKLLISLCYHGEHFVIGIPVIYIIL